VRTLNFNHLYYFWVVARLGGVSAASRELRLTQPTISAQIKQLEHALGEPLFLRTGREMTLTSTGQVVMRHAEEMFRLAESMIQTLKGRSVASGMSLAVGASDAVPKLIVRSILEPLRSLSPPVAFVCSEGRNEQLLAELGLNRLDLVITESLPVSAQPATVSAPLGESEIGLFAVPALAARYRRAFPSSLTGAPFVLPARGSALRDKLQAWFDESRIRPVVAAEADDRAMLNYLGQAGFGIIPAAAIIEEEITRQFGVERIGWCQGVRDEYYAVVSEHRRRHPAVSAVLASGRARFEALDGHNRNGPAAVP
jgi:LysR family transcriptional activator of nhaA